MIWEIGSKRIVSRAPDFIGRSGVKAADQTGERCFLEAEHAPWVGGRQGKNKYGAPFHGRDGAAGQPFSRTLGGVELSESAGRFGVVTARKRIMVPPG